MAAINDLISQIADVDLRERIQREVDKLNKQKKFGLVFEEHLPECTPLYDMPVKSGCNVMLRNSKEDKSVYVVLCIDGEKAACIRKYDKNAEKVRFSLNDIVRVAEFGEPIYPYLKPVDSVCNAPDSNLWHTLIEADNFHALQLLGYLYAGQVDCIYIDPPYNTGAKDWKYNNDYVGQDDQYRHSKWLAMMERRLKLAKCLLNPKDSVLIVTIDEKEYLRLGMLLEQLFPEAQIQMISATVNPHGAVRKHLFARTDEYVFLVLFGEAQVIQPEGDGEEVEVRWWYLRRSEPSSFRASRPNQFYPIYVDNITKKIVKIGNPLTLDVDYHGIEQIDGATAVFPIKEDGTEKLWGVTPETLKSLNSQGLVRVSEGNGFQPYVFRYVSENYRKKIDSGRWAFRGERDDGTKILVETKGKLTRINTVWQNKLYDAGLYGSTLLRNIIGEIRFSFPKSLYVVKDSLRFFVANKKNALIVDFFAGSGTTLHAVNLLNAEDGGNRRCILITNNEVSDAESKELTEKGYKPGDDGWERIGIARYVTWPRTVCSIEGHDVKGKPLEGNYLSSDIPMSDGFKANVAYFKLGFLEKTPVALGMCFREMLPTLWMKAGAVGKCPEIEDGPIPDFLILPDNRFAVLINENAFAKFAEILPDKPDIQTVFINTDYEVNYRAMAKDLNVATTYQLYRDYLDHFRINHGRN